MMILLFNILTISHTKSLLIMCQWSNRSWGINFLNITAVPSHFHHNGQRMLENGLVVPGIYSLSTLRPLKGRLISELNKKLSTIKHMKLEIGDTKKKNVIIHC